MKNISSFLGIFFLIINLHPIYSQETDQLIVPERAIDVVPRLQNFRRAFLGQYYNPDSRFRGITKLKGSIGVFFRDEDRNYLFREDYNNDFYFSLNFYGLLGDNKPVLFPKTLFFEVIILLDGRPEYQGVSGLMGLGIGYANIFFTGGLIGYSQIDVNSDGSAVESGIKKAYFDLDTPFLLSSIVTEFSSFFQGRFLIPLNFFDIETILKRKDLFPYIGYKYSSDTGHRIGFEYLNFKLFKLITGKIIFYNSIFKDSNFNFDYTDLSIMLKANFPATLKEYNRTQYSIELNGKLSRDSLDGLYVGGMTSFRLIPKFNTWNPEDPEMFGFSFKLSVGFNYPQTLSTNLIIRNQLFISFAYSVLMI